MEGVMAGAIVNLVQDQYYIDEIQPSAISKKHFNSVASLQDDTPVILGGFAYVNSQGNHSCRGKQSKFEVHRGV